LDPHSIDRDDRNTKANSALRAQGVQRADGLFHKRMLPIVVVK
jgi:hypothetical protein